MLGLAGSAGARMASPTMKVAFLDHVARFSGAEIGMLRFIAAADDVEATVLLAEDGRRSSDSATPAPAWRCCASRSRPAA